MATWSDRTRLFLSDYAEYVAVGLVVLALLGGFLAYEPYVDPGTEVEEFEESSWSSTAAYTHEATVIEQTAVFEEGQTLRNQPAYFESISPVLNGTFSYNYQASDSGDLDIDTDLTLVLRSADDEGIEYWREQESLTAHSEESVQPGDEITVPFSVNVTEATQRVEFIEGQLGGTPGTTEIIVEARLRLSGERNGQPVDTESTHRITIVPQGNTYSVDGADSETDSGQQFGQRTVEATYGPLRTAGGPLLLALSVLGIGGIAVGRRKGWFSVSESQREWMAYRSTRSEFDEWITEGRVPSQVADRTAIEVDTLEGLVDVAIDSDRRVISDASRGVCVVVLEDSIYRFSPPERPTDNDPLAQGDAADSSDSAGEGDTSGDEGSGWETDGADEGQ